MLINQGSGAGTDHSDEEDKFKERVRQTWQSSEKEPSRAPGLRLKSQILDD